MSEPVAVAARFATAGAPIDAQLHTGGHINDTWFVTTDPGARYVLQRINSHVFVDAAGVAENTARVVAEIERHAPRLVPPLVRARDRGAAVIDANDVYRMLEFVDGRALGGLETIAQANAAGLAFGRFQAALAHYDAAPHVVPIPRFHALASQDQRFERLL